MKSISRIWAICLSVALLSISHASYAATCSTPAPNGCGDANVSISSAARSVLGGGSISAITATACCDCNSIKDMLANIFDSLRQNFILGVFHDNYFETTMLESFGRINTHLLANAALSGNVVEAQGNIQSVQGYQEMAAQSMVSNQSSEALCRFASLGKSLGADDVKHRKQQLLFSEVGLARSLGTKELQSSLGKLADVRGRLETFSHEFCDRSMHNNALRLMCGQMKSRINESDTSMNSDINFAKIIAVRPTLSIDLTDKVQSFNSDGVPSNLTKDETSVIAMGYNLYGHLAAPRFTENELRSSEGEKLYTKYRSLIAGRSLAANSFYAMVADRAEGTGAAQPHMKALLQEMGVSSSDAETLIGTKPSYYAQMNVLARTLYQNTNFYGTLMEGKTNVARQSAYMDSIDLMQDRDIYQSSLRTELLLSSLIELQTRRKAEDLVTGLNGGE